MLAADVKHSFDLLTSKYAAPGLQIAFGGVAGGDVEDERTIRFDLKDHTIDNVCTVAGLPVFSRKWGAGPDGKREALRRDRHRVPDHDRPLPDRPGRLRAGASSSSAATDYWATRPRRARGQYNFDRIVYRYYKDGAVSMEAFKAGEFDIIQEYSARALGAPARGPQVARRA